MNRKAGKSRSAKGKPLVGSFACSIEAAPAAFAIVRGQGKKYGTLTAARWEPTGDGGQGVFVYWLGRLGKANRPACATIPKHGR